MSNKRPQRITVLSEEFTPAAMEFHRRNMSEQGYRMEGGVTQEKFFLTDGIKETEELFDGKTYYAVTFVCKEEDED